MFRSEITYLWMLTRRLLNRAKNLQIGNLSFPIPSSGEGPPPRKKRASLQQLPQTTISSLPDDLILSCLARVSRLYYPTLSLVSKKFRSLLASPELYEAQSLLGRTETCLYVCFFVPEPRWFILGRKPDAKKKKKKSFGYVLEPIPIPPSPCVYPGHVVAVGSNIYAIGGDPYSSPPSSSVSILDCRTHTWHEAPSMRAERKFGYASVCDGKIYVAGGCQGKNNSSNWMEVYDPKTQTWESVRSPVGKKRISSIGRSAVIEGEIFMFGNGCKGLAYKPKEDRWTPVDEMALVVTRWDLCSYSVIDKILYCYCSVFGIKWYDSNVGTMVDVNGLKELPKTPLFSCVKMLCYGGKMAVLWVKNKGDYKTVWCAVIALEKRNNNEIWGNVESIDEDVLTVPSSYDFNFALTATI